MAVTNKNIESEALGLDIQARARLARALPPLASCRSRPFRAVTMAISVIANTPLTTSNSRMTIISIKTVFMVP